MRIGIFGLTLLIVSMTIGLFLVSCGKYEIDINGTISHKLEIDVDNLQKYFLASCAKQNAMNVESCASEMASEFLMVVLSNIK